MTTRVPAAWSRWRWGGWAVLNGVTVIPVLAIEERQRRAGLVGVAVTLVAGQRRGAAVIPVAAVEERQRRSGLVDVAVAPVAAQRRGAAVIPLLAIEEQ